MQDVADVLGVTKMTVSRAFRHDPKCGAALRGRILRQAAAMGYCPDPLQSLHMARLRGRRTPTSSGLVIGFLDMSSQEEWRVRNVPSNRRVLLGAETRAVARGLKVEVLAPRIEGYDLKRLKKVMETRNIRGLIVGPMSIQDLDFDFTGIAAVAIAYSLTFPVLHRVCHDHYRSLWDVMEHLYRKGRRRIGMAVAQNLQVRVGHRWHAAYHEFCRTHPDMSVIPPFSIAADHDGARFRARESRQLRAWVKKHAIEVVLGVSAEVLEAVAPLQRAGRVSCLDLDGYPGKLTLPHLAIDQQSEKIGGIAVDEVLAQMERYEYGIPEGSKTILLPGKLVEMRSQ